MVDLPKAFRYHEDEHPVFRHPSGGTRLWRYLDFTKLVALLEDRALFLSCADRLGDRWEGSVSPLTVTLREATFGEVPPSDEPAEREKQQRTIRGALDQIPALHRRMIGWTFISCWHASEHESAAMWAQYVQSGQAVAIRTTFDRLVASLPRNGAEPFVFLHAGLVEYVDYTDSLIPEGNAFAPFMCKRKSFEHEREVRVVTSILPRMGDGPVDFTVPALPGVSVPVDLNKLVVAVHLAPGTPGWIARLIESQVRRAQLDAPVEHSMLDEPPTF